MAGVNGGPDPVIAAILGVSTLNFILLGWLGVTVLLNAEHRRLGVWLIAGALFSGTVFFVLQAAVAAHGVEYVAIALYFQWPLGWGIGILLPAVRVKKVDFQCFPLLILVKKNLILTIHSEDVSRLVNFSRYAEAFVRKLPENMLPEDKVTTMLCRIIDENNNRNFEQLREIEDQADWLSESLLDMKAERSMLGKSIYEMKHTLIVYLNTLWRTLDVLNNLRYGDADVITDNPKVLAKVNLLVVDVTQQISLSEHMSEVLASGLEVLQSIYNNQLQVLNNRMALAMTWLTILGTAVLVAASGLFALYLAGLAWWWFAAVAAAVAAAAPAAWFWMLQPYQKDRLLTFLDPERDPLGAGWNIIQSKIAIGAGGLAGQGWGEGSQSHLDFVPEHTTDFIFAVLAEEFGWFGVVVTLALYLFVIGRCLWIAAEARDGYSRLLAGSLGLAMFVYVLVNGGMVSGLLPVVGVPMPLLSYGGTAAVSLLAGMGVVMSIAAHRPVRG